MRASPFRKEGPSACVLPLLVFSSLLVLAPARAFADDGGCVDDAGNACDAGAVPPMPCDGGESGLCDTTNGASCSSAGRPLEVAWVLIALAAPALLLVRRRAAVAQPETERSQ